MEKITITSAQVRNHAVEFTFSYSEDARKKDRLFLAISFSPGPIGCAIVPFGHNAEGSTVFLPFQAQQFYVFGTAEAAGRKWTDWKWQPLAPAQKVTRMLGEKEATVSIPLPEDGKAKSLSISIYRKASHSDDGWSELTAANDPLVVGGKGDQSLATYDEIDITTEKPTVNHRNRLRSTARPVIYQLFVRHFSNTNETRKTNGTVAENGVGKFSGIDVATLESLKKMGVTHLWLTGILQQATGTEWPGMPADDPDLLKGIAGSPYAVKDYFDVCPDFADNPAQRLSEFKALLERIHGLGMKVLIDFIPNHVARSYGSDVRPEVDFGKADERSEFFAPQNNFFYLSGEPPLRLPTQPGEGRDGFFDGEKDHGKVTGNNVVSWAPSQNDWYETIKLNYGYDFVEKTRLFPCSTLPAAAVPDTWNKMDAVLAYWQEMGVDGFRCDMSHMIPPEFWKWEIHRARERSPEVYFMAEAYNNDPAKVPAADAFLAGFGNVMIDLLDAGFNAVYDDPSYKTLKGIYEEGRWANDLTFPGDFLFQNSLRYAENHDEVRLGSKGNWGNVGAQIGPALSAILFGMSRGAVMIYNGQEFGEKAEGVEGFGKDDGRSSIFDYWSLPALVAWKKETLTSEQKALQGLYAKLIGEISGEAFTNGQFVPLNEANKENPDFGRLAGETASGHWLCAFLRLDPVSKKQVVVSVNLNPTETMRGVKVLLSNKTAVEVGDIPPASWVIK